MRELEEHYLLRLKTKRLFKGVFYLNHDFKLKNINICPKMSTRILDLLKIETNRMDYHIQKALEDFQRDGVCRINDVFSKGEMDLLRANAIMALNKPFKLPGYDYLGDTPLEKKIVQGHEFPALLFFPSLQNDYIEKIRVDERMVNIVKNFLGNDVKQLNNQIYYRLPGDEDSFSWHQDIIFRTPLEDHPNIENGYIQTIIVVDELTEQNGAIEFIPGSHRYGDLKLISEDRSNLRDFSRDSLPEHIKNLPIKKYTANPGDVLIWDVLTVHGSEMNGSDRMRMTYMNGWAKAECSKYFPYYLKNGEVLDIDMNDHPAVKKSQKFKKELTIFPGFKVVVK